ncbi:hypothetical protein HUS23_08015 [Ectothiorhodospiraceae bacterium 2226]|nr:hypothetical protein HUS23_08015 [Ectothiorhodospiraceae bacterium 2226]
MDKQMFFCAPQRAYLSTFDCMELRERPIGKAPMGSQPRLKACERCSLYPLVDAGDVPTVSLADYLNGARPEAAELPKRRA